jgi:hypothetical protein
MAETRSNDDATIPPEPHSGFQIEGSFGRSEGRQDPCRICAELRCASQPDNAVEEPVTGWRRWRLQRGQADQAAPVDLKALQAKIGELTLENDFLGRALVKAGLLSARK